VYIFALSILSWILTENHTTNLQDEWRMFVLSLGLSLFLAGILWVLYVALEPYVRRRWPNSLISWNRLLGGRLRDPRVGRDVLVGMLAGVALDLVGLLQYFLPRWLGLPPGSPIAGGLDCLHGFGYAVGVLFDTQPNTIFMPMALVLVMLLFRGLLRRQALAVGAVVLLFTLIIGSGSESPATDLPTGAAVMGILMFLLLRFGLLAAIVGVFFSTLLQSYPATTDFSAWYAWLMLFVIGVAGGLAIYAVRAATAGTALARPRAPAR
jgi:serine/threonine-protein kinase